MSGQQNGFIQDAESFAQDFSGGGQNQQQSQPQQQSGGFMQTAEDGFVNQGAYITTGIEQERELIVRFRIEADQWMNKEGIPAAADGYVNQDVDKEVNKIF
jgi:hypothetical protein